MDGSIHSRYGKGMPDMQGYSQLPRLEVSSGLMGEPNLLAVVTSPGWREMTLSARVVAMTLLALARMDEKNRVTISRKGLSDLTGITDPSTLAKTNRELEAIGLFEIDRGFRTKYAWRPTVYRLTWWSQAFQRWLSTGYAVTETATVPHPTTSVSAPLVQKATGKEPHSEAHDNLLNTAGSAGEPAVGQKEKQ